MADPEIQDNPEDRPEWLPEKFKSPDELVNSYSSLEKRLGELTANQRALEEAYNDVTAQYEAVQQQGNQQNVDPEYAQQWLEQNYDFQPNQLELIARMASNIADQKLSAWQQEQKPTQQGAYESVAALADYELRQQLPDWDQYRGKVAEVIQQYPHLVPQEHLNSPLQLRNDLINVYKLARSDDQATAAQEAAARAAELEAMKENAQSIAGANSRPMPEDAAKAEWDRIKSAGRREGGY